MTIRHLELDKSNLQQQVKRFQEMLQRAESNNESAQSDVQRWKDELEDQKKVRHEIVSALVAS